MINSRIALVAAVALTGAAFIPALSADAQQRRRNQAPATGQASEPAPLRDPNKDKPGIQVGDTVPDTTVVDKDGEEVSLNSRFTGGLTLVMFYRGGWCPYCSKSLAEWGSQLGRFKEENIKVIAISPETPEHAAETVEKGDLGYTVYTDATTEAMRNFGVAFAVDAKTQQAYKGYGVDLAEKNASGEWILPAPAFFLIDEQGRVVWQWATWDYTARRASPDDVLTAARDQR